MVFKLPLLTDGDEGGVGESMSLVSCTHVWVVTPSRAHTHIYTHMGRKHRSREMDGRHAGDGSERACSSLYAGSLPLASRFLFDRRP